MPSASHGFQRVMAEGVPGLITYTLLSQMLVASGHSYGIFFLNIISILSIVVLYDKMTYWSLAYIIGWAFGLSLLGSYLFEWWELLIYLVITGIALYVKINNRL